MSKFQLSSNASEVKIMDLSKQFHCFKHLYTKIRDQHTNKADFVRYATRIMTMISEEGVSYVQSADKQITTPPGQKFDGCEIDVNNIVVVSIIRAGDSLLDAFLGVVPEAQVGKILIQRDEVTKEPILYYSKLPPLEGKHVILLDPMVATGGSAKCAIKVLLDKGADENRMTFLTVISCPYGNSSIATDFPKLQLITGCIGKIDIKIYRIIYIYIYIYTIQCR
jgi:uracil phosphoribosyltransferase